MSCLFQKIILSILVGTCFSIISTAQVVEPPQEIPNREKELSQMYSHLSKNQKTTGFILIGGGIGLIFAASKVRNASSDDANTTVATIFGTIGFLSAIAGISYLSVSSGNKKKSRMFLKQVPVAYGNLPGLPAAIPAAGVTITLGSR